MEKIFLFSMASILATACSEKAALNATEPSASNVRSTNSVMLDNSTQNPSSNYRVNQSIGCDEAGISLPNSLRFDYRCKFNDGRALVSTGEDDLERYGFVDSQGKIVIPLQFVYAENFSEQLAKIGVEKSNKDVKFGYIDSNGKIVIPAIFDAVSSFSEGVAAVMIGDEVGFINHQGEYTVQLGTFDDFIRDIDFSNGPVAVAKNDKWGFIDSKGNIVIPLQFDSVTGFTEGVAQVMKKTSMISDDYKIAFINQSGKLITGFDYDDAGLLDEGFAWVKKIDSVNRASKAGFIND
ncbi:MULTISPECIES: WG repeat-containing protein [unclassified Acinetobacter]|uniref:WG repeat-containing protein n=1 Tax=unclassified Acinetobacter TaxID=196816 RepID=UPI0035B98DBF